ncbi:hypothetical protein RJT34_13876 [Clitoria ternatea]
MENWDIKEARATHYGPERTLKRYFPRLTTRLGAGLHAWAPGLALPSTLGRLSPIALRRWRSTLGRLSRSRLGAGLPRLGALRRA